MRAKLIGHFQSCMTEIYLHMDARMLCGDEDGDEEAHGNKNETRTKQVERQQRARSDRGFRQESGKRAVCMLTPSAPLTAASCANRSCEGPAKEGWNPPLS